MIYTKLHEFDVLQVEWPPPSPRSALEIWPAAVESSESRVKCLQLEPCALQTGPTIALGSVCQDSDPAAEILSRTPETKHDPRKMRIESPQLTHTGALTITVIWNPRTFLFNDKDRSQFYTFSRLTRILWKRNECSTLRKWCCKIVLWFSSNDFSSDEIFYHEASRIIYYSEENALVAIVVIIILSILPLLLLLYMLLL